MKTSFISLLLFFAICSNAQAVIRYYVSPTGTGTGLSNSSQGSFNTVRALWQANAANDDIAVFYHGGTYTLSSTITLTSADSGQNGHKIYHIAYPNEQPVFSGGIPVTGWTLYDAGNNIYSAPVPTGTVSRTLFVNDQRATRVRRTANMLSTTVSGTTGSTYRCTDGTMPSLSHPEDIEFGFGLGMCQSWAIWEQSRLGVASAVQSGGTTTFTMNSNYYIWNSMATAWGWTPCDTGAAWPQHPAWMENAYEFLNSSTKGQWFLDTRTHTLYYVPRTGENMTTATAVLGNLETLMTTSGAVSNVEFWGIAWEHTTWNKPTTQGVYASYQAGSYLDPDHVGDFGFPQPAVSMTQTTNVKFERNIFKRLGGGGLYLGSGSNTDTVEGNVFTDISGQGIKLAEFIYSSPVSTAMTSTITVNDNYIHDLGVEYQGSTPIVVGYTDHVSLLRNEIANNDYTGISFGWGWLDTGYANSNVVAYNKIHDIMLVMGDGGGIYLNGSQGTVSTQTLVHDNYIYNIGNSSWGSTASCYYSDNGNQYANWYNNICADESLNVYAWWHSNANANTTATSNYATTDINTQLTTNGGVLVDDAIDLGTNMSPSSWGTTPQAIAAAAGVGSSFSDILSVGGLNGHAGPYAPITTIYSFGGFGNNHKLSGFGTGHRISFQ